MSTERKIDRYVNMAWDLGATDVLLLAGHPPIVRLNGDIQALVDEELQTGATIHHELEGMLSPMKLKEFDEELEVDFTMGWKNRARVRGNAFMQRGMPTVSLRIIPEKVPTFDDIGLPSVVRTLAALKQGLVLFTGPTGSGKSTSLAAMVDWINRNRACHILTIEDPIEYVHRGVLSAVSQRELGSDTKSFERALRSALREDPDVILVGEMRDPESISLTLTLAETGHLVMSTLHTNDSAQALDRIVDVFPGDRQTQVRLQLAGTLQGIIAQRLVPSVQGGMVAAFEVLIGTQAVHNLVREGKTTQLRNNLTLGQSVGMQTLEMSLNALVAAGRISYDQAIAHAVVPKDIVAPTPYPAPPIASRR